MADTELARERAHVERAAARLDALIESAESRLALALSESSRHGATLTDRDVFVHRGIHHLDALKRGTGPLCFGRIDLSDGESLVIGRTGVSDENSEPLVVDWRARAAAPFYRATGLVPQGVFRRRHYLWRHRTLVGLDDELLDQAGADLTLVGEGALLRSLDAARSARMGDIVATIQREQHDIIHAPLAGVLVVQGGPGTGKTAVALHRAAYLLYAHRFPLERQGVLFIGPNRRFLDYISDVLPSLGEDAARLVTPTELVDGLVRTIVDEPQIEALKHDSRMAGVVGKAVRDRQRPLQHDLHVPHGSLDVVLSVGETRRLVAAVRAMPGSHYERASRIRTLVLRALGRKFEAAERSLITEGLRGTKDDVSDEEKQAFMGAATRSREVRLALRRMWPVLTGEDLIGDLLGSPVLLASAAKGRLSAEEIDLLAAVAPKRARRFSDADVALIDEASAWLGRPHAPSVSAAPTLTEGERFDINQVIREQMDELDPTMKADVLARLTTHAIEARGDPDDDSLAVPDDRWRRYGHIIVDEAQDLSPMQWRMIARRTSSLSMTLVGDLAQGTSPWSARSWDEVIGHIRAATPLTVTESVAQLTIGYRTPSEVMDFAEPVLAAAHPDLRSPRSVRSSGVVPTMLAADLGAADLLAVVTGAVSEAGAAVGEGTVGVIGPPSLVPALATRLDGGSDRVTVLDPMAAKGLEFDAVVVVEPTAICALPGGLSALYIALTRPTQYLTIVHSGDLPTVLDRRAP